MKRFFVVCIFIIFSVKSIFSYGGVMTGEKKLRMIKTKHFDIIYSEDGRDGAALIAQYGEEIYRNLAELYNLEYEFRLPVTISSKCEGMNAYFSPAPFNHIVLFPNKPEESFSVFSDSFINIFRHELTHAFHYNLKNQFWYKLSSVMGDSYTAGLLTNTPFMYEGIAVRTESMAGEGRANDNYSLQMMKQAKIEGKFPNFAEIQGALDIYPSLTASYIFGGYFWQWLAAEYGQEKLEMFLKRCSNLKSVFYFGAFKKVYGFSLESVWNEFYESIEIPDVAANPVENDYCDYLMKARNNSRYSILACSDDRIFYYDSYQSGIFCLESGKSESKKVLSSNNIFNLSVSSDGRYLVTESNDYSAGIQKTKLNLIDLSNDNKIIFSKGGVSDATVVCTEDSYYLLCHKFAQQEDVSSRFHSLVVYKIGDDETCQEVLCFPLEFESSVFSLCDGGDGRAFFLYRNGLEDYICSLDLAYVMGTDASPYESLPQLIKVELDFNGQKELCRRIRSVSAGDGKIIFSYNDKKGLVRFGIVECGENKIKLMSQDLSGGVYSPVLFGEGIACIGKFYYGNQLFKLDSDKIPYEEQQLNYSEKSFSYNDTTGRYEITNEKVHKPDFSFLADSRQFGVKDYVKKGTFIPASVSYVVIPDEKNQNLLSAYAPIGLTYVSSSPWTFPIYGVSGGYSFLTNTYNAMLEVRGKTNTDILNYTIVGQAAADNKGFRETFETVSVSSSIPLSNLFNANFSGKLNYYYGKMSQLKSDFENKGKLEEKTAAQAPSVSSYGSIASWRAAAGVSNLHSTASGTYEAAGFSTDIIYIHKPSYENLGLYVKASFPRLLPFRDDTNWTTYNLPFSIEASLFTSEKYFLQAAGTLILFSSQLQYAAIRFPVIYFNKFNVSLSYVGKIYKGDENKNQVESWAFINAGNYLDYLKNRECSYNDEMSLNLSLKLTPNVGGFANTSFGITLVSSFKYRFFPAEDEKHFDFTFTPSLSLF